jgi:hypothetical protein
MELKSAQLIIKILQDEFKSNTLEPTTTENSPMCVNSIEWKLVSTNKDRINRIIPVQKSQLQSIPTIPNQYTILDNLNFHSQTHQQREHVNPLLPPQKIGGRITESANTVQEIKRSGKCNKKTSDKKQNKIIIIGDCHARGCEHELQHKLEHGFEVQGFVKPGANLQTIANTSNKTKEKLKKKDFVVVWGGTRDVGRNESMKGLQQMRNFVDNHKQTNVIVMSVPYRHDLASNSCVNEEVKVYNRKLKKHLKVYDKTCVLEVDTDRDLFTRHELHMKPKGKKQAACKIMNTIKAILNEKKSVPIKMNYKEDLGRDNKGREEGNITRESRTGQENSNKNMQSNTKIENQQTGTPSLNIPDNRSSTRQRKAPKSLSDDFLWQQKPYIQITNLL